MGKKKNNISVRLKPGVPSRKLRRYLGREANDTGSINDVYDSDYCARRGDAELSRCEMTRYG